MIYTPTRDEVATLYAKLPRPQPRTVHALGKTYAELIANGRQPRKPAPLHVDADMVTHHNPHVVIAMHLSRPVPVDLTILPRGYSPVQSLTIPAPRNLRHVEMIHAAFYDAAKRGGHRIPGSWRTMTTLLHRIHVLGHLMPDYNDVRARVPIRTNQPMSVDDCAFFTNPVDGPAYFQRMVDACIVSEKCCKRDNNDNLSLRPLHPGHLVWTAYAAGDAKPSSRAWILAAAQRLDEDLIVPTDPLLDLVEEARTKVLTNYAWWASKVANAWLYANRSRPSADLDW